MRLFKFSSIGLLSGLLLASGSLNWITSAPGVLPATAQVPVGARVIHVNPVSGNDTAGAGSSEATPYKTITYALLQAKSGTVVQLARGSYSQQTGEVFPLVVPGGVMLRGEEPTKGQTVAILGGGNYVSPSFARQSVTIRAEGTGEIRGISVTNPNTRGTGIWIEAGTPTIANSTLTKSNRDGIFVSGTANPKIESNVFTENQGNGVSIARAAKGEIKNNLFQNTGFGLAIGGTSTPIVSNNQIIQNNAGVYINDSAKPVLRGNTIEGNKGDGIVATVNALPDLGTASDPGKNTIRNNGGFDVNNSTTSNQLVSNGNVLDAKRVNGNVAIDAPITPPPNGTVAFNDITGHWAQAYIEALAKRNIVSGFPDNTFRPGDPVTRAQFAAIINKAFTPAPTRPAINFADVPSNYWGFNAIQTAARGGFMRGYDDGSFRPELRIPRVQVLVALANGLAYTANGTAVLSKFQDAADIPSWAVNPVAAAAQRRMVVNFPIIAQLAPNREATRAEVAAFVYQALVDAGKADPINSPYIVNP